MKHLTFALIIAILLGTTSCVSSPRTVLPKEEPAPQIFVQETPAAEAEPPTVVLFEAEPPNAENGPTEAPQDECAETIQEEPVEAVSGDVGQTEQNVDEVVKTPFQNVDGDVAVLFGNILPQWFVYTCAGLILAFFFTLCFISRQKRFTRSYRD